MVVNALDFADCHTLDGPRDIVHLHPFVYHRIASGQL